MEFEIYDEHNAPESSKSLLESAKQNFGMIPNLLGEFAEAPAVLEGYLKLNEFVSNTSFSAVEQQVAILAASIENECDYCSAIHSTVLRNQLNVDDEILDAIRNEEIIPDEKLQALVSYVRKVVAHRGHVSEEDLRSFEQAGYTRQQVLEINLIVALKTLSNYTNHVVNTPLDEAFQDEALNSLTA